MVCKANAGCLKCIAKIKNTQEGKIWPIKFHFFFFFHSKQLLLKKQSHVHWCTVFILQLKGRTYNVNGQLVLSPHLLPPHKECHCIVESPSWCQTSHPALQVKRTLGIKKQRCCKGTAVAKSSPWSRGSAEAEVASGPSLLPSLCLCVRVRSLIKCSSFPSSKGPCLCRGAAQRLCTEWSPCQVLFPTLKRAPGLPGSHGTRPLAKSLFHPSCSSFVHGNFWF